MNIKVRRRKTARKGRHEGERQPRVVHVVPRIVSTYQPEVRERGGLEQVFNHRGEVIDRAEHDDCPASSAECAIPRIGEDAQIE